MSGRVLVTGGIGFVGTNLVHRLLAAGRDVVVLDDASRPGVRSNLEWLSRRFGSRFVIRLGDVRDPAAVHAAMHGATSVFHLAAQVAVTHGIASPLHDFDVNARGTLNVLEAARTRPKPPFVLFTSTHKVYGALQEVPLMRTARRWQPEDPMVARTGVSEQWPLSLHSPYGCSKGAADQYVLDYARTFGVPSVSLRMSCTYGPHQMGNEDQGWVAHFCSRALAGLPVTIYGDGRQVRDVLFVDDLIDVMLGLEESAPLVAGHAFNLGGGAGNTMSLLELCDELSRITHRPMSPTFASWRVGDQRWYVSDVTKVSVAIGWRPRVAISEGIARLVHWMAEEYVNRSRTSGAA